MAPAPSPDSSNFDLLQTLNAFWGLIAGLVIALWTMGKAIWNFGSYSRGVNDRLDKIDKDITDIKALLHPTEDRLCRNCPHQKS